MRTDHVNSSATSPHHPYFFSEIFPISFFHLKSLSSSGSVKYCDTISDVTQSRFTHLDAEHGWYKIIFLQFDTSYQPWVLIFDLGLEILGPLSHLEPHPKIFSNKNLPQLWLAGKFVMIRCNMTWVSLCCSVAWLTFYIPVAWGMALSQPRPLVMQWTNFACDTIKKPQMENHFCHPPWPSY